jgi:hypothetical protein
MSIAVARGCPQGGVLSPLLWSLVVDELLTGLNQGWIYAQGYVDDICLLTMGKFPNTISGLMQWALNSVEERCDRHGLSVNPDKTGLVAFTQRRKLPGFFEPRLFGMTLRLSESATYLGVILDVKLTWKKQVDASMRKARHMMWACRRVFGRRWGLRPRVVSWPYASVVRPSITYASLVWWPGCEMARAKQVLRSVQRLACLGITEPMCTKPTNAMEALVVLPPLDLVVQGEATASAHHLWSLGSWSYLHPNSGHTTILVRLHQLYPVFNMRVDVMRPAYNFEPKYRVKLLSRKDWTIGTGTPPIVKGHVWFTDGSWMEEGLGLGSMGNLTEEGSAFPFDNMLQFFRPKCLPFWPVLMILQLMDYQGNT